MILNGNSVKLTKKARSLTQNSLIKENEIGIVIFVDKTNDLTFVHVLWSYGVDIHAEDELLVMTAGTFSESLRRFIKMILLEITRH